MYISFCVYSNMYTLRFVYISPYVYSILYTIYFVYTLLCIYSTLYILHLIYTISCEYSTLYILCSVYTLSYINSTFPFMYNVISDHRTYKSRVVHNLNQLFLTGILSFCPALCTESYLPTSYYKNRF